MSLNNYLFAFYCTINLANFFKNKMILFLLQTTLSCLSYLNFNILFPFLISLTIHNWLIMYYCHFLNHNSLSSSWFRPEHVFWYIQPGGSCILNNRQETFSSSTQTKLGSSGNNQPGILICYITRNLFTTYYMISVIQGFGYVTFSPAEIDQQRF